ncbi:MAG: tetratricopeptide repeat protein [Terriglobia bacterium]
MSHTSRRAKRLLGAIYRSGDNGRGARRLACAILDRGRWVRLLLALMIVPAAGAIAHRSPQVAPTARPDPQAQQNLPQPAGKDDLQALHPLEDKIERGQYQEAVPGLRRYLELHPNSARAHYDLGYAFFRIHQIGGAVTELSRSLAINVNDAQAHKILGLVCTFVGRYDLAETELRSAAQLEPDSAEIHYWLGRIYYTREVYPLALKEFETAVRLDPSYVNAYTNLGLVTETLGKVGDAVRYYKTAVRLNEQQRLRSPWPYEHLSALYDRQHEPRPAIESAEQALLMDPRCDLAYYDIAKAYQAEKDWQQSADAAQKAIAINSRTPEYYYILSVALRRLGKITESEAALKQFQQIHKNQNAAAELWQKASSETSLRKSPGAPRNEP